MKLTVAPGGPLRGQIQIAPDKSISHRAVMLSAVATGTSRVHNLLRGMDVLATLNALRQLGAVINDRKGVVEITGRGLTGLRAADRAELDLGNSGTAMRLLTGLLCGQNINAVLTGDASLRARPMQRIIAPLAKMGARIESANGRPPLTISPAINLRGLTYAMPVASAQVKSCLLLAGLHARGATVIIEPGPTRDHTERMLTAFGRAVRVDKDELGRRAVGVTGDGELRACELRVPGDLSAAAFFIVGASVIRDSDILITQVGINPTRAGLLTILKRMGANIELTNQHDVGGEPVADIRARFSPLRGCKIAGDDIALAIDEIPALAIAAACARGATEIRGAGELRVKESDRIGALVAALGALGAAVDEHPDGMTIHGGGLRGGASVDSRGDHRIAMAMAIAGGAGKDAVEICDCANIATSFPDFCAVAARAGLTINAD